MLTVDKEKKMVTLTHKKSLVTTRYPIVTDYAQLKSGMLVEGYIYHIKDCGVFVRFFNDVQVILEVLANSVNSGVAYGINLKRPFQVACSYDSCLLIHGC